MSNSSLDSVQGMGIASQYPRPEIDGLDFAYNLRKGETPAMLQSIQPQDIHISNLQPSSPAAEQSSSPKNQPPLITRPTTNSDFTRRSLGDATMSPTSD